MYQPGWPTANDVSVGQRVDYHKQIDVSDQSSGAQHPNKNVCDPASVRLANVNAECAEI